MAFQQYQNTMAQPAQAQDGQKKKQNFRIGRIYGSDGTLDVGVWCSDKGGVYTSISARAAIGKDPSTGSNAYEQKMSGELPSVLMNAEYAHAFLKAVEGKEPSQLNFTLDTGRNTKLSVASSGNTIKITIDGPKGNRCITLDPIVVGATAVNSCWDLLVKYVEIGYKKALFNKLDPEEFQMAVSETTEQSEETPF